MSFLRTLAFLTLIGFSCSETQDCSYLSLLKHLNLTRKNDVLAIMRPVRNWTTETFVQVDMLLYGLLKVDEKSQSVTSHIWIQGSWKNEFLTWNPADFCGIDFLAVPRSMLWVPDLNIMEDTSDTGSIQESPYVSLSPNGSLLIVKRQRLTSTCQLRLYMFPFDVQWCNITFHSMTLRGDSLKLGNMYNSATLASVSEQIMITQGEWELKNIKISKSSIPSQDRLIYMVKITRKPMLYVINLIVPLFYLLILDLASFFIDEARGEKLGFKVTVLLSISVLLLILQDMLPSTEDQLPLIANYCIGVFILVGVSLLEAILVSFLVDLDGDCSKGAQSSIKTQVEIQLEASYHKEPPGAKEASHVNLVKSPHPGDRPRDQDLLKLILEEMRAVRQEVGRWEGDKKKPGCYRQAAKIMDSVFFVLYFLTIVIFLSYLLFVGTQHFTINNSD